ncbi:family 10 glycosylhydrolase [Paenibacillus sp. LHD-117]|uniref:family 10 glycosylhydrolase n=1 Tax=Paenibacillus sp. LHD-117 TaxID=3071412 RepID=UPI0027E126E9|nr:family 10 glycosylhydrolase [Paenibacillus sp. LHD-117]MDQ6420637.1 family 10 glycosylhydrolase [Paenibacillus sp. LHD-117]
MLVAFTMLWGSLLTGNVYAEQQTDGVPQEISSPTVTTEVDSAYGEADSSSSPNLAQPLLAVQPTTKLIEDFEELSDIAVSEIRTIPGSTKLVGGKRPEPVQYGHSSGKFSYDFTGTEGTSAAYMNFNGSAGRAFEGYPNKIGMWVYGDEGKHWLRAMFQDNAGSKPVADFTSTGGFSWGGWRYVTATIPAGLQEPIKLRQIYIAETNNNNKNGGTVYFDQLSAIYTNASPHVIELTGLAGMAVGDTRQAAVLATANGNTAIADVSSQAVYTSSAADVATVSEQGLVEAIGLGTTTITATFAGLEAAYVLTVGATAAAVESLELEGSTRLVTGDAEQLRALAFYAGQPEPLLIQSGVIFASSDPLVATVTEEGALAAVGEGTSVITAAFGGQTASYTLTVSKPVPVLQTIRIDGLAPLTESQIGQAKVMADYSLLEEDSDVTGQAVFASSNPSVATVSDAGLVTAIAAGTARIKATFEGKISDYLLIVLKPSQLHKRELRAAWIASVENIDWPAKGATTEADQKAGFISLIDGLAATGINAVIVQIKPTADAFYPSEFAPWSEWLTGKQGQDPGYDPLAFMIEEVHKRNMEFHAWFNPYRVSMSDDPARLVDDHPAKQHPEWVESYGGKLIFNPGVPEAKAFVIDSVMEVVDGYDIDAVHFDDYFYPYPADGGADFPDEAEYAAYGGGFADKAAWRRNNVDTLIQSLSEEIKASKPYVKFGISPFGIWRNKSTDPKGSDTNGLQSHDALNADSLGWVEKGWIDYIAPQDYWHFGYSPAAYEKVLDWWRTVTSGKDVHLYVGQAIYRVPTWENPDELANQIRYNRSFADDVHGNMLFSAKDVLSNARGITDRLANDLFRYPALPPAMTWLDGDAPDAPALNSAISILGNGQTEIGWTNAASGSDTAYYAIYRQEGSVAPDTDNPALLIGKARHQPGAAAQSFADNGTEPWKTYTYVVTALDRLHNESAPSEPLTSEMRQSNPRQEKILAKNANARTLELEYSGVLKLADNAVIEQRLGDKTVSRQLSEVMVGAGNATFTLNDNNEIVKISLQGETPRDTMRIGIRSSIADITDLTQLNHAGVSMTSAQPFQVIDKLGKATYAFAAGDSLEAKIANGKIQIARNGETLFETENRIYLAPDAGALLQVTSITRAHGKPSYRGSFELFLSPAGDKLRLINEVNIEHYLYQVVPSEMPASFGLEALKAQAVAARTYALTDYVASRFADQGFHIDDSTLSQVYNNQVENALTTQAIDATSGQIMLSDGMLVDARFYSTSGGFGASKHEVWADAVTNKFPGTPIPYLTARSYTFDPANAGSMLTIDTSNEEAVRELYQNLSLTGYDSESLYFRWKVGLSRQELENTINNNIKVRYAAEPHAILTKNADGGYASLPLPEAGIGELKGLIVAKRGAGGNVTELIVEGSTGTYKILKEFNIRFTIRPNKTDTGSAADILAYRAKGGSSGYDAAATLRNPSILYSAFFAFETETGDDGRIETVTFYGGGNGHGVGMSQYGAQMLAKEGKTYDAILNTYYANMAIADLETPIVTSIAVSGETGRYVGQTDQLSVGGSYSDGSKKTIGAGVSYVSSRPAVASVDELGRVRALSAGETVITVTVGGFSAEHRLTVIAQPVDPGPGPGPGPGPDPEPEPEPEPGTELTDIERHWAEDAIKRAVKLGIVQGFDDDTFRPQREVTRAEFVTLLMRAFPQENSANAETSTFKDVSSIPDWAKEAVDQAVSAGLIDGYDDGTFRPGDPITRSEITALIVRAAGLQPVPDAELAFVDADEAPAWARGYIAAAVDAGLMQGRGGNRFAPNAHATRAEAVVLLLALLDRDET